MAPTQVWGAQVTRQKVTQGHLAGWSGEATSREGCLSCESYRIRRGEAASALLRLKKVFWLDDHVILANP